MRAETQGENKRKRGEREDETRYHERKLAFVPL